MGWFSASVLVLAYSFVTAGAPAPNGPPPTLAGDLSAREAIARAGTLTDAGDHARAAEILSAALESTEPSETVARARVLEGDAWTDAGRWDSAVAAYAHADLASRNPNVRALARFRIGQARFNAATQAPSPDDAPQTGAQPSPQPPATPDALERKASQLLAAAAAFRSVLDLDPDDAVAARNTERCRRLAAELLEQAQEQRQQQQAQQQLADQLQQLAEEQQQRADDTAQSRPQDAERLEQDQQQTSERTEQAQQQADQAGANGQTQEAMSRARASQEQAEQALREGDPNSAREAQEQAAQALREAAESLAEQSGEQRPGDEGGEQGEQPPREGEGEEQADEAEQRDATAQALLERERRQREARDRQRRATAGRPVVVERDW
jgi:hypothetical protein